MRRRLRWLKYKRRAWILGSLMKSVGRDEAIVYGVSRGWIRTASESQVFLADSPSFGLLRRFTERRTG